MNKLSFHLKQLVSSLIAKISSAIRKLEGTPRENMIERLGIDTRLDSDDILWGCVSPVNGWRFYAIQYYSSLHYVGLFYAIDPSKGVWKTGADDVITLEHFAKICEGTEKMSLKKEGDATVLLIEDPTAKNLAVKLKQTHRKADVAQKPLVKPIKPVQKELDPEELDPAEALKFWPKK